MSLQDRDKYHSHTEPVADVPARQIHTAHEYPSHTEPLAHSISN